MSYLTAPFSPSVQEPPSPYSPFSRKNVVYEVSLRVSSISWLEELPNAHRVVQTLLQGELLGDYELLDFLIWSEGLLVRISLGKMSSLAEFLRSLKEKSTSPQEDYRKIWEQEPQWIRLVTPERLTESTRSFLQTAETLRQGTVGYSSNLFFFYRNSRLSW